MDGYSVSVFSVVGDLLNARQHKIVPPTQPQKVGLNIDGLKEAYKIN